QFDWEGRCLARVRLARYRRHPEWWRVYRYSPVGTLVREEGFGRGTFVYEYDAAHRLVRAITADGTQQTFTYDAGGNLLSAPGLGGVTVAENRLLTANGRRFEYDRRHHVAREVGADSTREYAYDAEDRLTTCVVDGRRVEFRYDALGRRVAKITAAGTTEFVWDGERLAAEIAPDRRLRVYVYADGDALTPFVFVDYPSADAEPGAGRRHYVIGNQLACPVLVEDDLGEVVWRAEVDAYGRARVRPGSRVELNLRWPGHYHDPETGLHYNRYRYYSPELGRYIQVDPRDLDGGINVYAYPARPLDTVDVDGLAPCPKKPMVTPSARDKKFQKAKAKADRIAENMRDQLKAAIKTGRKRGDNTQALENTTIAAMVVTRPKNKYEVVVTANRSPQGLPRRVREAADGSRWIGHGDDRPPPVRQDDESSRYQRDNRNGDREETTHSHAEQRGLRANDCDPDTGGVAYIAPTRPCCEGCSTAIQTPHNSDPETSREDGGWGGSSSNVSDRGRQPDPHGVNWWED
ncbi:MAG TPA: RHS repeat-associated core domain-containing protein, partial [Phytomonospora sp.]